MDQLAIHQGQDSWKSLYQMLIGWQQLHQKFNVSGCQMKQEKMSIVQNKHHSKSQFFRQMLS